MATLINIMAVTIAYAGQALIIQPGDLVSDTAVQAAITAEGGLLITTTDTTVAAAAALIPKFRAKGADEGVLNAIMLSAVAHSAYTEAYSDPGSAVGTAPITVTTVGGNAATVGITAATDAAAGSMSAADKTKLDNIATATGSVVQHLHIDVPKATIVGETSGAAFAIGAALPANARVLACDLTVTTAIAGVVTATATVQGGSDSAGSLVASANVFTGTIGNVYGGTGSNPYASRGGQQLYMTITGGAALSGVSAGDLDVDVFYTVQA